MYASNMTQVLVLVWHVRERVTVPLVTMERPKFTQDCPFPFDDHHPHLIHQSVDRSE